MSDDEGVRWCPNCGAEYRKGFETCTDCGVALVDERPPEPDHDDARIDVAGWDDAQREGMELRLVTADVPHSWEGDLLVVPHAQLGEVEEMIDEVEAPDEVEPAVVLDREPSIAQIRFGAALVVATILKVAGVVAFVVTAIAAVWFYTQFPDELPGRVVQPILTVVGGIVGGGTLIGIGYGLEIAVELFEHAFNIRYRDDV